MTALELVRVLLRKRGISETEESSFLSPDYDLHTHAPSLMLGMKEAVMRILRAIESGERIAVYADFDCDGIPGAVALHDFFTLVRYSGVEVYIPHRDREGYGFHKEAIDQLFLRGVKLIITVDVGTVAFESCSHAKALGIDVIITDHHEPQPQLPVCVALLNPKRAGYPFPDLCGAAVAYKLVQQTLFEGRARGVEGFSAVPDGAEKWLLDMVGIATVADMVPLIGENRVLAHYGLKVLRKSRRPGIRALCAKLRLRQHELTEDDIGFSLAPRLNAASRMDEPELAFRLLATNDPEEAEALVELLESLNASRKGVAGAITREAKRRAKDRTEAILVLGNPEWKPALLGLAANSVMNDRGGVVCLWGRDAQGRIKGSCRSDGSFSIVELFEVAGKVLDEAGGHAKSGGFSVSHEQVHKLPEIFTNATKELSKKTISTNSHDAELLVCDMTWTLYQELSKLSPFGIGNEKPLFRFTRARIKTLRHFGKEKNHLELMIECVETGSRVRAFEFFTTGESFSFAPSEGSLCDVIGTVERDTFKGSQTLSIRISDLLPATS